MDKKAPNTQSKVLKVRVFPTETQKKVIRGLGLTKKDQVVEHYNSATIMGMVNKVPHLVSVVD